MPNAARNIAIVCPGSPITRDIAENVAQIAARRGAGAPKLHFADQCFETAGHFAGPDAAREAAFIKAANDPEIDAVWFGRGGYGATRFTPDFHTKLADAALRKIYLGYSDAGFLLAALYKHKIGKPVHGPMPADITRENGERAITRALDFLSGAGAPDYEPSVAGEKPVAAFNITVLAHMANAAWMPDLSGHVVLLEEIGEHDYRIDRSMFSIVNNQALKGAAGVKLGRISETPENDRPFGQDAEQIVRFWCARVGIDYLGRADIGHDGRNKIVPFGLTGRGA